MKNKIKSMKSHEKSLMKALLALKKKEQNNFVKKNHPSNRLIFDNISEKEVFYTEPALKNSKDTDSTFNLMKIGANFSSDDDNLYSNE